MAILTNKSDVISNFVRYYGRQPGPSDMATIDYLTTKPPQEVEQLLAKTSPVTNGLVWSEYQNNSNQGQPSVPPASAPPASAPPAPPQNNQSNLNTTPLGLSGVNALFDMYYGRDATQAELDYWATKSDAELRPKLIPNSESQLAINRPRDSYKPKEEIETQESVDNSYSDAVADNPAISELAQGGSTLEEIINALSTGNLSGIVDFNGQPFSVEDQQAALAQGMEDNKLYYEAMQAKDTADAESSLAQNQSDYQNYLINSGQSFEADKSKSDKQAADSGVLFSGSRVQKEKNLERAYNQDQSYTRDKVGRDIGSTASDFQYNWGNEAASGLNQYYNLGSNTYNANTARGGVGSSGLSSVYNSNNNNFQGTRNTERSVNANTRAAGYLWNKGNKLLSSGYNNQY